VTTPISYTTTWDTTSLTAALDLNPTAKPSCVAEEKGVKGERVSAPPAVIDGSPNLPLGSSIRRVRKLRRLLASRGYRRGLRYGVAAAIEHEGMLRSLRLGSLIDVGANIGQFSLLARTLYPEAPIHAFEPLPAMADRYAALFAGDARVTLYRIAAGETAGSAVIHVSGRPDSSSLLPISERQNEIFPGTAEVSSLQIPVERVDDVIRDLTLPEPILAKLDVQGFELAALKGMLELLTRASHVYAEVSFLELYEGQPLAHEIISWLASQRYRITGAYNPTLDSEGAVVQSDILFSRA